ncbi:MAG: hypothetical protein A4E30_00097 [Methanomassiliicoccales archaeon PtaB.Bin215]|nr:MAG: hypothetical protein A4E30_00097 [Methanomassiliicoccales archaeon PtaB.Bin215]
MPCPGTNFNGNSGAPENPPAYCMNAYRVSMEWVARSAIPSPSRSVHTRPPILGTMVSKVLIADENIGRDDC